MKIGFNKHVKVMEPFIEKNLLCPKWDERVIFKPKINGFDFFSKSALQIFLPSSFYPSVTLFFQNFYVTFLPNFLHEDRVQ